MPVPQPHLDPTPFTLLAKVLIVLVITYAALVAVAFAFQARLIYYPSRQLLTTPRQLGMDYKDVHLITTDDVRIHGWFVPAAGPDGTVRPAETIASGGGGGLPAQSLVLYFHGNGGNISHRVDVLRILHDLGLDTLIIDYRGYGQSGGRPGEEGTYQDAAAAWRYLAEDQQIPPSQIIVWGESLGGGVASWVAQSRAPRALVLQSTFTRLTDIGAAQFPWLPVRLLSRHRYPTIERLAEIRWPLLVIHSRQDDLIPFAHAERNFAAAQGPKEFLEIRGGHNDGVRLSASELRAGVRRFLEQN